MENAIKVKSHKGIIDVELTNLSRINVLSGKNNSGKSSILEAVNDKAKCSIGFVFKEEKFEELFSLFSPLIHTSQPSRAEIIEVFRQFVKAHHSEYLFKDYEGKYLNEFKQLFKDIYRLNYSSNFSFDKLLQQIVQDKETNFKPCLIDPKRSISCSAKIDTAAKLSTNGENLLNHIFYLKNQVPHSIEFENYNNIFNVFKEITGGSEFNVLPDRGNNIQLQFRINDSDKWFNASNCGLGLREILLIVSFAFSPEFNFIQIEEPENHLHPEYQRRLLRFINTVEDKQFLISTHSSIFLDTSYVDKIFYVYYDGQVFVDDKTNKAKLLNELGYSTLDNLVSDLIILTEGPKDFPIVEEFLKKIEGTSDFDIKFWPLGGDIMSQIDLSWLKENNKLIALIDRDPKSSKHRRKFKEHCKEHDIECIQLKRYAIENYFTLDALKKVFGVQIPNSISKIESDKKLEDQIGINVKNRSRKISQAMILEDIQDTDFYEFLVKVRGILNND